MKTNEEKWLYLPMDIKVRELHSKTLIAAEAAKRGYKVILGRKAEVSSLVSSLPKGVFVGFGAHENFYAQYKSLKKKGHSVIALDEEGLLTFSEQHFKKLRLSEKTLAYTDAVLTWGDHHSAMVTSFSTENNITVNVRKTGNARFDILSPNFEHIFDKKLHEIKQNHGPYFLIVSSFGSCNHFDGREKYTQALKDKKIIQSKADSEFYENYFNLKQSNLDTLLKLIPDIAEAYPKHKIIIRPHPSENHALWESLSYNKDQISVLFDGNIHPWILAADAVLHHFCTTALECYISHTPSIAIRSIKNEAIETELPYKCSYEANDISSLQTCIDDIDKNKSTLLDQIRSQNHEYYTNFIENLNSAKSYKKIVDVFDETRPRNKVSSAFPKLMIKSYIKSLLGKNNTSTTIADYQNQKFNSLNKKEVSELLRNFEVADSELKHIKVQSINRNCVVLYK